MTVRNSVVARGVVTASSGTPVYTVPAGQVLLLKFVGLQVKAGTPTGFVIYAQNAAATAQFVVTSSSSFTNNFSNWSGWTVLNATDRLFITVSGGDCFYWIAGALLPFAQTLA